MDVAQDDVEMQLGVLEQSPRLRTIYTQLCFCYSYSRQIEQITLMEKLSNGLERLTASFPWVAGQITTEAAKNDGLQVFGISSLNRIPGLICKDQTQDVSMPTMETLRAAGYPFRLLDEKNICPRTTLSVGPDETDLYPFPVLILQANFIRGGLVLTVQACHGAMDIVGQVQIIRLLSKACHDQPFTAEEVADGNLDRRNLIPLLDQVDQDAAD